MKDFLKSIDERVWLSVENGWERPTTAIGEWTTIQKEAASSNSKAMSAIFNVVSMEEFKRISNVEIAHIAWMSKKQNSVSLSTVEAEYIAAGSCCSQLIWIKKLLGDYGLLWETMVIYCDNSSAIDISKNMATTF